MPSKEPEAMSDQELENDIIYRFRALRENVQMLAKMQREFRLRGIDVPWLDEFLADEGEDIINASL